MQITYIYQLYFNSISLFLLPVFPSAGGRKGEKWKRQLVWVWGPSREGIPRSRLAAQVWSIEAALSKPFALNAASILLPSVNCISSNLHIVCMSTVFRSTHVNCISQIPSFVFSGIIWVFMNASVFFLIQEFPRPKIESLSYPGSIRGRKSGRGLASRSDHF